MKLNNNITMNKLCKHISVILFLAVISCAAYAQQGLVPRSQSNRYDNKVYQVPNQNSMNKVQVIKERFISRQLSLNPDQSERFWPLYRQYQSELSQIRQLKRQNLANGANSSEQIKKDMEFDSQLINIRRRYNNEFLKVLPPEKVSELYKSERGFTDELIKNLNERNGSAPE
jgi:hypothetical protein